MTIVGGRIGLLEDDPEQARQVENWLRKQSCQVTTCHDGDSFLDFIKKNTVDLLLLDWCVPKTLGIDVLQIAREELGLSIPIMMLTQYETESDIVKGLTLGADDYLVKPVGEHELVARIMAQLRRHRPACPHEKLTVGRFELDPQNCRVLIDGINGKKIAAELSKREFDLAWHLFQNAGRIVPKDTLLKIIPCKENMEEGHDDCSVRRLKHDAMLATYISTLRRKLELRAKNGVIVSTVYNYGYRLERLGTR